MLKSFLMSVINIFTIRILKKQNNRKEIKKTEYKIVLRFPKFYRLVPIICGVGWILLSIFGIFAGSDDICDSTDLAGVLVVFVFILLLHFSMAYCWNMWEIRIGKDELQYRNMLGIKKRYRYIELTYAYNKTASKCYFYKNGKKVFSIPYFIDGDRTLFNAYKKSNDRIKAQRQTDIKDVKL